MILAAHYQNFTGYDMVPDTHFQDFTGRLMVPGVHFQDFTSQMCDPAVPKSLEMNLIYIKRMLHIHKMNIKNASETFHPRKNHNFANFDDWHDFCNYYHA